MHLVSHLAGQLLILLHQLLILLVDGQHLADTVGSSLSLRERDEDSYCTFTTNHISLTASLGRPSQHADGVLCSGSNQVKLIQ